jgi:hypothetical protein
MNIHYASLELDADIPVYECNNIQELKAFELTYLLDNPEVKNRVWLLSINDEEFVTENVQIICSLLEQTFMYDLAKELSPSIFYANNNCDDVFLQEYPSFEDAYEVALDMQEGTTDLCYSPDNKIQGPNKGNQFSIN